MSSKIFTLGAVTLGTAGSMLWASDDAVHVPEFPWPSNGMFDSYDTASLRRGWQVYKEVCASCHSIEFIAYRNLVGTILNEEEAKAEAADQDYEDGPDNEGEMFDRPGKLIDPIPRPYPNDEAARAANNNALPPDLSLMVKARHGGADYIFALLTGYRNAPAGVEIGENLYYNSYFPGQAIGMTQALQDEMLEYEDGTHASISQMAKDVSHFLAWTAEPEHDERKKMGLKNFVIAGMMAATTLYWKRVKWSSLKSRQIRFWN